MAKTLRGVTDVLLLCLLGCAGGAAARDSLSWLTDEIRPAYIFSGADLGTGFADRQLRLAIENLPEFDHHILKGDSARILHDLTHRGGTCALTMAVSPIRESLLTYSGRAIALPGYRLIVQAQRIHEFDGFLTATHEIDLAKLDAGDKMSGVFLKGRAYPSAIETFINSPLRKIRLAVVPQAAALTKMVEHRRVDFSFATRIETDYENRALAEERKLASLPIAGVPANFVTKSACGNDPVGRAAISALDRWLNDDRNWARFMEPLRQWLDNDSFQLNLIGEHGH